MNIRIVCPRLRERVELGPGLLDARGRALSAAVVHAMYVGRWRGQYVQLVETADPGYELYDDVTPIVERAFAAASPSAVNRDLFTIALDEE